MKKIKIEIPKRKYHHNELPTFVIDETNKTIFISSLILVFSIFFTIRVESINILLFSIGLVLIYLSTFFYCFYRHFIFDNLLIYDGYITYYPETDSSSKNVVKQIANRYMRKLYTIKTAGASDQDSYFLKTFIKGVKLRDGMKVRLFVLPDSFIKNRDGSFNVVTIYTEILQTPNKKKGKK